MAQKEKNLVHEDTAGSKFTRIALITISFVFIFLFLVLPLVTVITEAFRQGMNAYLEAVTDLLYSQGNWIDD